MEVKWTHLFSNGYSLFYCSVKFYEMTSSKLIWEWMQVSIKFNFDDSLKKFLNLNACFKLLYALANDKSNLFREQS